MLYNNNEKSMGFRSQKLAGPGRLITLEDRRNRQNDADQ